MAKCKILVVGAGSIGTVCAYALEQGGLAEVTVAMRSNYDAVLKNGVDIDSIQHGYGIKSWRPTAIMKSVPEVSGKEAAPFDFIVVTIKNIPDEHPTIVDIISPAVTPGKTAIVLAQNGLNIEKPIVCQFPTNPIISSVVFTGASRISHSKVYHTDPDIQRIGLFYSPQVPILVAENAARRYIAVLLFS